MDTEVQNSNYLRALQEIEKSEESKEDHDKFSVISKHVCKKDVPIAERGGEVLDSVNEVFNLMAMKIQTETRAR